MNPTRNHEVSGSIPCLAQCVKDLALLWLWLWLAAVAPIGLLAAGAALKRQTNKPKKTKREAKKKIN